MITIFDEIKYFHEKDATDDTLYGYIYRFGVLIHGLSKYQELTQTDLGLERTKSGEFRFKTTKSCADSIDIDLLKGTGDGTAKQRLVRIVLSQIIITEHKF